MQETSVTLYDLEISQKTRSTAWVCTLEEQGWFYTEFSNALLGWLGLKSTQEEFETT